MDEKANELSAMASAMGKKGGRSRSDAKVAAARENGRKGGRPRGEAGRAARYAAMVAAFNAASGRSYVAEVRFLRFRRTSAGILVSYSAGRPEEVRELRRAVFDAGAPYYCKF